MEGSGVIVPRRNNIAHVHRPWRAKAAKRVLSNIRSSVGAISDAIAVLETEHLLGRLIPLVRRVIEPGRWRSDARDVEGWRSSRLLSRMARLSSTSRSAE